MLITSRSLKQPIEFRVFVNVNGNLFHPIFAARNVIDNRFEELETTSKRLEQ